ncbi:organic hydroperoxide resistance protein [Paraflavitalea pollutisoli]|uniref:organic hydroperoxide resistance protein n=1 Tax=Paraflavitalea pollutisoli TaxID=3034143 RepID=UPI0023EBF20E|nr:organic hydroperoxide resistance protein [Paraflavitalea sp. H1-2-19X]
MGTITRPARVLYTAKTHTTGGREHGLSKSSDGRLEVHLASPASTNQGTNPEQLFAAGWSACFEGAMQLAAQQRKVTLPDTASIDAEVDLRFDNGQFSLEARMNITIPELSRDLAKEIVEAAESICPYSKAVKGNIVVEYNLV